MRFKNLIYLICLVPLLSSCRKHTDNTAYVYSTACTPTQGCVVNFEVDSQTVTEDPFIGSTSGWNIQQILINASSELLHKGDIQYGAGITWIQNPIPNCTINENKVTCTNFMLPAPDVTITGIIDGQLITKRFKYKNKTGLSPEFVECGNYDTNLKSTTYQRMFDCAQRVKRSGGIASDHVYGREKFSGTGDNFKEILFDQKLANKGNCPPGKSVCNPDLNWFLVSCPGTGIGQCFWLTPVLAADNPVLQPHEYTTLLQPMSELKGGRLLWSGISAHNYDFFQANGNNPLNISPSANASYTYYNHADPTQRYKVMAKSEDPLNSDMYATIFNPAICATMSPPSPCIDPPLPPDPLAFVNVAYYSAVSYAMSVCDANRVVPDPNLLQSDLYTWQLPSYPMAMTLTGGELCTFVPEDFGVCNPVGFKALTLNHAIPDFNNFFWTSSVSDTSTVFLFGGQERPDQLNPKDLYGVVSNFYPFFTFQVRCVSAKW